MGGAVAVGPSARGHPEGCTGPLPQGAAARLRAIHATVLGGCALPTGPAPPPLLTVQCAHAWQVAEMLQQGMSEMLIPRLAPPPQDLTPQEQILHDVCLKGLKDEVRGRGAPTLGCISYGLGSS